MFVTAIIRTNTHIPTHRVASEAVSRVRLDALVSLGQMAEMEIQEVSGLQAFVALRARAVHPEFHSPGRPVKEVTPARQALAMWDHLDRRGLGA
jgi:hypothetical protein